MVEEEDEINQVDMDAVLASSPAPVQAAPQETAPTPVAPAATQSAPSKQSSSFNKEEFLIELDQLQHCGKVRIAPAAGWWMRTHLVYPHEVTATGPKGYITKGDVLAFLDQN